jgi:hypothetical protein
MRTSNGRHYGAARVRQCDQRAREFVTADEGVWRSCFAATRAQVPSEWSDLAVEILTVLAIAGSELAPETKQVASDGLAWFLRHRTDVLHEAMRWAGLDIVSFHSTQGGLGQYSNERALVTLQELRARLGG